ncbi:zinc finger protein 883-like [Maniola hyperantus]|uniref:zinc finger protein 883-like n=1 Tax=Aphantopus hyperantus TaxID=2795564 RepID=UPI001568CB8E|nr:zinc finger protein 721-like [Maniola hyperantus]
METKIAITCSGCLNNGRRMVEISEINLQKCFSEIISENMISRYSVGRLPLQLCFECAALLLKFTRFKLQVAASYKTFQNLNSSLDRKTIIRLQTNRLPNMDMLINCHSIEVQDVAEEQVKEESGTDVVLDERLDGTEENLKEELSSHEDEIPLIKIKKKKKKLNVKLEKDGELEFIEVLLDEKEIKQERVMLAMRDDYVNAMFTCDRCILTFPNEDDLNDHILVKHQQNASLYKCSICTCSFSSEVSLTYHTHKHTRRYQCTVCADRFASKRSAVKHYNLHHCPGTAIEYQFEENNLEVNDPNAVKDPEENNVSTAEENSFPCDFCAKIFKWKTSLRKHLEKHRIETGQKRKPYCAPCRLSFTTTPNLQKHVRTSSKHKIQLKLRKLNGNSESNDTGATQKQSKQRTKLMDEIKSSVNNSQPKYLCHQCDKVFLWRGNLYRHLESHAAKAKGDLVCKPCNRTFSSIATYQQHMKISKKHASENDFKYMCSECGKRFPTKSHLKDHINWEHLKNYVYTCDECQKVFKTSNSVYLHKQAVHKKDCMEHLCDHCGKGFPNNTKLRNHILGIHSGGALRQCPWCDARFSWQSCLSRHVRQKHRKIASKMS